MSSLLDLDHKAITNTMANIGWLPCPPDYKAELIRQQGGDNVICFRAISTWLSGHAVIKPHNFVATLGETPHFICPYSEHHFYHTFFDVPRQRFYETKGALKDFLEVTPYLFEQGLIRAHYLVNEARSRLDRNERYPFDGIYKKKLVEVPGEPQRKPILNILSPGSPQSGPR